MLEQPVLNYEPHETNRPTRRPKWVIAVVLIYLLLMSLLLLFPAYFAYDSSSRQDDYAYAWFAGIVGLLVLGGFSLILIPVRVRSRRPIRRAHIAWSIIGSGMLLGLLVVGGGAALVEWINFSGSQGELAVWIILGIACLVWAIWSVIFLSMTWSIDPNSFSNKLHRKVLAGSVLELLVAVPAHVVVRQRSECCAGIYTGFGICMGVAVMLISFGPGVLLLYWRRAQKISNK